MRPGLELGRGMDPERYRALVRTLRLPSSAAPHLRLVAVAHGVSEDAARSVYAQEVQANVKRRHAALTVPAEALAARWLQAWGLPVDGAGGEQEDGPGVVGGNQPSEHSLPIPSELDLVQAAYEQDVPPCVLARRVLEALDLGLGRAGATAALRDPGRLPELVRGGGARAPTPSALRVLGRQLAACVDADTCCSPAADEGRRAAGAAAEGRLDAALEMAGAAFWTEPALRARGFFKTPDACLAVPLAVAGCVVHWIDSKATFGDGRMHRQLLEEQYELYVHRFGPGMVIYWHGFVDDIARHPGVLVTDGFPMAFAITHLPRLRAADLGHDTSIKRVLFCTEDMESAYRRTKAVMAKQLPGVEVVQCHRSQAAEAIRSADIVVPIIVPVTAAMVEAAPRLKLIIQYGVGIDAIDLAAATSAGVLVANIPSAGTGNALSVAEHAIFLALATLRHPKAMAQSLRSQLIGIPEGQTLFGSTVLVIGYGHIARHIVSRLQPFGARVLCLRASEWTEEDAAQAREAGVQAQGVFARDMAAFAAQADVVIVAATLNPTSAGLIGAEFLAACKPGVHIVNIARGGLLDREAVKESLKNGKIGGMGLDVYWDEPYGSSPLHANDGIAEHPRVYMTPHVAGVTAVSYQSMAERLTDEIQRVVEGRLPTSPINRPENMRLQYATV